MKDKFRVGQKVRLKEHNRLYPPIGARGEVIKSRNSMGDYEVLFELYPCPIQSPEWVVEEEILEPIYDGDEKSSWSECAWKPNNLSRQDKPLTQTEKHVTLPT